MSTPVAATGEAQRPRNRAPEDQPNSGKQPASQARTGERLAAALALAAAILLETLPLAVWLFVLGAAGSPPAAPALPFWWICVVLLAAWGVAALQRTAPREGAASRATGLGLRLLLVLGFLVTVLLSLLVSPVAYASTAPAGLPAAIAGDVAVGSGRLGVDVVIGLLVAYLWWRGILLGRLPLTRDRLYVRFIAGLIAVILAVAITGAATGATRRTLSALLAVVLPLEVFIGLVGIALAHLSDSAREHRERRRGGGDAEADSGGAINRAWVTTALGISAAVVIGGLVLALLVSYDSVRALADLLRPLADALGTVLFWLIEALAFVLFLLLNGPITWLKQHSSQRPQPQQPSQPAGHPGARPFTSANIPHGFEVAALIIVVVALAAVLVLMLLWVLRRFNEWKRPEEFEEQREALRPGEVLGAQWRDLLGSLRRRRGTHGPEEETLGPDTVRYLFREVLRRAARAGKGRRPAETAQDYAARLVAESHGVAVTGQPGANGMAGLSEAASGDGTASLDAATATAMAELRAAYEAARYGTPVGNAPAAEVAAAASTVERWLAEQAERQERGMNGQAATSRERGRRRRRG